MTIVSIGVELIVLNSYISVYYNTVTSEAVLVICVTYVEVFV